MDRKKGHRNLFKKDRTSDKLYAQFSRQRSFGQNRKDFHRHTEGAFELRNASRDQLLMLRRKIIRRRLRNLLIAVFVILVLFAAAMLGLGYLLKRTSEAKELLKTSVHTPIFSCVIASNTMR